MTAAHAAVPAGILVAVGDAQSPHPRILSSQQELSNPALSVRPAIGTGWRGHIYPGPVAPFGLVQLSPDTSGPPERRWNARGDYTNWNHDSGYHYPDNLILGFSHTHLQGTGGSDLGDIRLMPVVEGKNWAWGPGIPQDQALMQIEALGQDSGWVFDGAVPGYRSFFSPEQETIRVGYYAVNLQTPGVYAELTATTRCGMHRYRFPTLHAPVRSGLLVDLHHSVGGTVYNADLELESNTRVSGSRSTHGWASDKQVYFVMEFSRPFAGVEMSIDGKAISALVGEQHSGEHLEAIFANGPGSDPLVVRVGLSCTSIEGAAKNLAAEIQHWDFDAVVRDAEDTWDKVLGVLDADCSGPALRETFYTGVYHGLTSPATFNDVDGAYRGQDRQNHANPGFTKYTILSIWDIYRGEFPFLTLTQPERINDIVRTLLADYVQLGLRTLPMWTLWGNETWSMRPGFHSAAIILAAYTRGFRDFDLDLAYTAIRDSALVGPIGKDSREMREQFRKYGYYPMAPKGAASVSTTLDLSYDYWCAGAMADLLGKHEDTAMFYKLGRGYKNVFDSSTGFMRGKSAEGIWREPFRPDQELEDYVEADAWQASFSVPHDVQGLIDLYGGDADFIAKLEGLFTAPSYVYDVRPDVTGMVGQDAQGNEPSNHLPYLFCFAGAPWKTQYWVRQVAKLYTNRREGIPGDDDCGQLSSWFALTALGFYPVNAANGIYVIGSPLVNRAVLHNHATGKHFTVFAENNSHENMYIQSAEMNGKILSRSWLTHNEIASGGELRFCMGSSPNKDWATALADRPPSGLFKGQSATL